MKFLVDHPVISHAVVAAVLTFIILPIFFYMGVPIFGWLTFAIVATYFYGRESGQNDHDCVQKEGYSDTAAFFGNILPILFHASNWNQFAVPAMVSFTISLTAQYFLPGWVATHPFPFFW
jgi:hypothetical protein